MQKKSDPGWNDKSVRCDDLVRELFDRFPHAAMIIGRNRIVMSVNWRAEELGVEEGKFCWDSFGRRASIPAADREYFEEHRRPPKGGTKCTFCSADKALASGKPVVKDVALGDTLWQTWWVPVGPDAYLHYAMDVTTSEKKLEADREWLDRVQKIVAMGIWDQYIPDNTLHWSEQTCRIFGLEPGTQPQDFDGFLKMVHPDDRETIIRKTERALASDDFPYRSVYRIRRQDSGEERILHEEARIERDREGNPVRMAGVIHDITEAQLERDELRRKVEQAESEINELRGLLPICSRCKSIRDDQGLWRRLEEYFESLGDLEFSHGMCPKCREELYPFLGGEGEDAE